MRRGAQGSARTPQSAAAAAAAAAARLRPEFGPETGELSVKRGAHKATRDAVG